MKTTRSSLAAGMYRSSLSMIRSWWWGRIRLSSSIASSCAAATGRRNSRSRRSGEPSASSAGTAPRTPMISRRPMRRSVSAARPSISPRAARHWWPCMSGRCAFAPMAGANRWTTIAAWDAQPITTLMSLAAGPRAGRSGACPISSIRGLWRSLSASIPRPAGRSRPCSRTSSTAARRAATVNKAAVYAVGHRTTAGTAGAVELVSSQRLDVLVTKDTDRR